MKAQQSFDAMVEDKINILMPYLVKTARGDEDLIQEGAIGIWESMKSCDLRGQQIPYDQGQVEHYQRQQRCRPERGHTEAI